MGRCCSAAGIVFAEPPHRHTGTAPAAMMSSLGVNSHRIPTIGLPAALWALAYSIQFVIMFENQARTWPMSPLDVLDAAHEAPDLA